MPEQFGHNTQQFGARPSRIDRRVTQRTAPINEHFVERRGHDGDNGDRPAFRGLQAYDTPTTYHGAGNFDADSGLVVGARFQTLLNAYLLWFFLGWVGAHRIFLKSPLSATVQAVLLLLGSALWLQNSNRAAGLWLITAHCLWRLADLYLIPEMVRASAEIES